MKKKIDIEVFKDTYLLRNVTPDFAIGRRSNLRFAIQSLNLKFSELNKKGPEPFEYLEYAKLDIQQGNTKGAINGLGNAKRAIHLTIKNILFTWGLLTAFRKASFPQKLKIFEELNAFLIKTIEALNRKRNIVEHEFESIGISEVEELIDIAEMFLLISYPLLNNAIIGSFVGILENDQCYEWRILPKRGELHIIQIKNAKFSDTKIGRIYYSFGNKIDNSYESKIPIMKSNKEDWLKYLDLFIYMTKRKITRLEEQVYPGENYFLSIPRTTFSFEL